MDMIKIDAYITQAYSSLRNKSKRRGQSYPDFSKEDFRKWCYSNGLAGKWIIYLESGCDKDKKPSVNRVDDYLPYEFSNMELITWRENLIKGVNGIKHHRNSQNQNLTKPVFIWSKSGELVKKCKTYRDASKYLDCHIVSISRAVTGRRKTLKKYKLTNTLTSEELTLKP